MHPDTTLCAGFSFIRNAIRYDYPVVEAITSILPICDYFVVAVGKSEDGTEEMMRDLAAKEPKIRLIETEWDDTLRTGGRVLAVETQKAFDAIPAQYVWAFYIQADECVHEADLPTIRQAMQQWRDDTTTEGLLFDYTHFYGSYDFIGVARRWYRREVRIVRRNLDICSWRDAQGFRHSDRRKLSVRHIPAKIYHYGWVKHPAAQQRKQMNFNKLWHTDETVQSKIGDADTYTYDGSEPLRRFEGSHPAVMAPRIRAVNWQYDGDPTQGRRALKERLSHLIENATGWRPGEYRNYRLIR